MSQPIRGLVFDKDGTLFDFHATWSAWCDGFIRDLCGPDPTRVERLARRLDFDLDAGRFAPSSPMIAGTMEVIVEAVRDVLPERDETGLRHLILTTSAAAHQIEVTPLLPLIDRLIAAGLTLGIATNDNEAPARAHLERAGILDRFAFVAGYDSGHGAKPTPGQLLAFCALTGIPPGECAMIGDSTHDLDSGRAAGMTAIGVLTGLATRADLAPHADVVLDDIAALPAWLGI
ncbi:MAG TPA: HAD family hydrolase [Amaricoccus sp.]|nr:HAD family hydrolase [Amaricoccus sp.]